MSHIVSIRTEIRDQVAIQSACRRLKLTEAAYRTVELYSAQVTGWAVQLPDWRYPIVCQTDSGEIQFDNFNGRWGDTAQLDRFRQAYAVEKAKLEARRQGHSVTEQLLANGSVRLSIQLGGQS